LLGAIGGRFEYLDNTIKTIKDIVSIVQLQMLIKIPVYILHYFATQETITSIIKVTMIALPLSSFAIDAVIKKIERRQQQQQESQ
jgi:hypothetical protein